MFLGYLSFQSLPGSDHLHAQVCLHQRGVARVASSKEEAQLSYSQGNHRLLAEIGDNVGNMVLHLVHS